MAQRPGWPLARVAILLAVGAAALPFLETTAPDAECESCSDGVVVPPAVLEEVRVRVNP